MPGHTMEYNMQNYTFPSTWKGFLTAEGYQLAGGKTVPSATSGYAPGCLFVHSDGASEIDILYFNTGTKTSCTFSPVNVIGSSELADSVSLSDTSHTAGAATAAAALRFGATATEGLEFKVVDEDVAAAAAASSDLTANIPAGCAILSVQANLETAVTATTAVKVGIGLAADPDKYGKTSGLTKNLKIDTVPDWAVLAAEEDVKVFAVDTNGAAAGTLDTGTIRVRIVYAVPNSLDDAS